MLVSFPSFLPPGTEPRHLITHGDRKRFPSGPTTTYSQKRTNEEEKKDEEGGKEGKGRNLEWKVEMGRR